MEEFYHVNLVYKIIKRKLWSFLRNIRFERRSQNREKNSYYVMNIKVKEYNLKQVSSKSPSRT